RPLRHPADRLSALPAGAGTQAAGRPASRRPARARSRRALRHRGAGARRRARAEGSRAALRPRAPRRRRARPRGRRRAAHPRPRDRHAAGARADAARAPGANRPARPLAAERAGHRGPRRPRRRLRRAARRRIMSRPVVAAELVRTHARTLKMPGLARTFEALARQAREERWTVEESLEETLSAEVASRTASAVRQRLQAARFPELKPLDTFDFAAAEGLDAAVLLELARGEWITRAENVLLV